MGFQQRNSSTNPQGRKQFLSRAQRASHQSSPCFRPSVSLPQVLHTSSIADFDPTIMSNADASSSRRPPSESIKYEEPAPASSETGDHNTKVKKRRLFGVDPSLILSEERSKRRRTPSPEPEGDEKQAVLDPKDPERAKQLGMQVYRRIMETEDSE